MYKFKYLTQGQLVCTVNQTRRTFCIYIYGSKNPMTNCYFKAHVHDVFLYLPFSCENLNHFTLLIEMCVNV